jgi:branched-chain amino acid transport system ATP-binding protein
VTALVFDNVVAGYGPYKALNGLSFSLSRGEAIAILGRNGAGKSTMARVATGLVPIRAGSVDVLDRPLKYSSTHTLARLGIPRLTDNPVRQSSIHSLARLGIVHLPEGVGLFRGLSIEENLMLRLSVVPRKEQRERLERALGALGSLRDRRKSRAGLLSGGQQRLVAVMGALAAAPNLLIADEPALGLSPAASDDVYDALANFRTLDTALVVIETRPDRVDALCPRALVMNTGRATYDGPQSGARDALARQFSSHATDQTPEAPAKE